MNAADAAAILGAGDPLPRRPERVLVAGTWVSEWQYDAVRDVLLARADMVVWIDLPRRLVMARTLRRRLRREVLWNGNVEPPLWTFLTERDHIVRWAWRTHPGRRTGSTPQARPARGWSWCD